MPYRNSRAFISFDYDHDLDLKTLLAGQAKNSDSPFETTDFSLKEAAPQTDWKERAKRRIRQVDTVVIVLGTYTHNASGVKAEVAIAKGEGVRVFQVKSKEPTQPVWMTAALYTIGLGTTSKSSFPESWCRNPLALTGVGHA